MTENSSPSGLRTAFVALALAVTGSMAGAQTTPESFFGHQLGADRELARWDRIVEYFELLERESDRVRTVNMGPSTEGNPFLLVIITSPENMANLDRIREVSVQLADPRGLSDSEIDALVTEGKAVVSHSLGLHATEVGGAQTAPELAYDLASRDDAETLRILDESVMLLFPCLNPDGQIMVTDWYRQTLGTEFEGVGLPWLYHKYVGHDNNRDGDYLHMIESVYTAQILYREWKPQAYVDHHQMGSYGARIYVPPYSEPIRPHADPLMWRELSWYGAHIAYKLEEHGKTGVLNAAQYPGWGHFGWHWITPFHNISGMLTESASASLATPLYVHPEQLEGGARGLPEYEPQSNMPHPWPGGWWRVRDIVEQQKIAAWAIQDMAARNRETVLRTMALKAMRQTERGAEGSPKAYVIPASQHDPLTANNMVNTLLDSDVEIQQAREGLTVDGMTYGAGTFVVPLAQPKTGLVRNLLGRTLYPDNAWTRARDGSPLRPYDISTHTMSEFMAVRVDAVDVAVGDFPRLTGALPMAGTVSAGGSSFVLDGRLNASFSAVNRLLDAGVSVRRVDAASDGLRAGDFLVSGGSASALSDVARETGVDFRAVSRVPTRGVHDVERMRVGMYHRYRGGNMDEGWTRFLFEEFGFPYTQLMDEEIRNGNLRASYDVIIFPHDTTGMIMGDPEGRRGRPPEVYPEEYMSGIGEEGLEAIREFIEAGGTLVTFGGASDFAIEKLELRVTNVVKDVDPSEFFCPGSTLRVSFDNAHPAAYGMPDEGLVLYWEGVAFEIQPSRENDRFETMVRYDDRDILQSGWLIGEEHLSNKAAMVSAKVGDGKVVLIGFRPQHRAQTDGTFKLVFNQMLR